MGVTPASWAQAQRVKEIFCADLYFEMARSKAKPRPRSTSPTPTKRKPDTILTAKPAILAVKSGKGLYFTRRPAKLIMFASLANLDLTETWLKKIAQTCHTLNPIPIIPTKQVPRRRHHSWSRCHKFAARAPQILDTAYYRW